jgi:hypothetical protein
MKWLWAVSKETHPTTCKMPARLEYFMDPMSVIKKYSGCKLHMKHSGISGVSLESVYCFVTGEQGLDGAHDSSLFDAQAQYYVCTVLSQVSKGWMTHMILCLMHRRSTMW